MCSRGSSPELVPRVGAMATNNQIAGLIVQINHLVTFLSVVACGVVLNRGVARVGHGWAFALPSKLLVAQPSPTVILTS